MYPDRTHKPC